VAVFVSRERILLLCRRKNAWQSSHFVREICTLTPPVQGQEPRGHARGLRAQERRDADFRWPGQRPAKKMVSWAGLHRPIALPGARSGVTLVVSAAAGGRPSLYPEDEAAGLMHSGYVRISQEMIVEEAIAEIRRQAGQVEMIYYAYVLDDTQRLLGVISFRELISAERSKKVRDVMRTDYVSVPEDEDKEAVAHLLAKHRLLAVPVVDADKHMMGIVSSADLAGVAQRAASEDILKIGGMEALEGPYLEVTFAQMVRKRAGWLAILFLGEMLTATAMGYFSEEISRCGSALFIPLIISSRRGIRARKPRHW
jgi:CBS domain-containing protein